MPGVQARRLDTLIVGAVVLHEYFVLKLDWQLFEAHLDVVAVADTFPPPIIDLVFLVLDHSHTILGTHAYHVVSLCLHLSSLLEHLFGSFLNVYIVRELKHAHLTAHLHDFIHCLSVNFLEQANF